MMKKLQKGVCLLLVLLMTVGICTSCKKSDEDSDGKVKISVGGWPSKEGSRLDTFTTNKKNFEKAYPDITIVPDTWITDLQTFYPKAEAGLLPNIFGAHFTESKKLIDGDYLADITDAMKEYGYYDKINPVIKSIISKDGHIYSFPTNAYMLGLVYNTDMFEKAGLVEADGTPKQPKNWEEMAEFAVKIKEATGKPGFVMPTSNNYGGWQFTNIAWSYGVKFMEQKKDGSWKATFNSKEAAEALQFIKDLKWKYDVLPNSVLIDSTEATKLYATGGAAMMIGQPDTEGLLKYDMKPKQFGIMAIPAGPKKHVALLGGKLGNISKASTSKQIDAAFKWWSFIGNDYKLDDYSKESIDLDIKTQLEEGIAVGAETLQVWNEDSERVAYLNKVIAENSNIKPNAARLYNESLKNGSVELQAEEPVCAQDLYAVLDNCIQEVLNNKDADVKAILKKANADFQTNYLDNVDY